MKRLKTLATCLLLTLLLSSCGEKWIDDGDIIKFKDPRLLEALLDGCYDANLTEKVQVDRDGDGQISKKEASVIKGIDISEAISDFPRLSSIEELKYFTALENLDCSCTLYIEDEVDMSANRNLRRILFYGNYVKSLDLSKNTKLIHLEPTVGVYGDDGELIGINYVYHFGGQLILNKDNKFDDFTLSMLQMLDPNICEIIYTE